MGVEFLFAGQHDRCGGIGGHCLFVEGEAFAAAENEVLREEPFCLGNAEAFLDFVRREGAKPQAVVCRGTTCSAPLYDVDALRDTVSGAT